MVKIIAAIIKHRVVSFIVLLVLIVVSVGGYKFVNSSNVNIPFFTAKNESNKNKDNITKKTYTNEQNNVKVELTYYAHGDDVFKQTAKNTIDYSSLDDSTIDSFKTQLDEASEKYQGIEGLEEYITYDDENKTAKEILRIDYRKVDKDKLNEIPGMLGDFKSGKKVSLKKSEKLLKENGFEKATN